MLDHVFLIASFFAEEEFYLLLLPLLFWCGDYRFARALSAKVKAAVTGDTRRRKSLLSEII